MNSEQIYKETEQDSNVQKTLIQEATTHIH